MDRSRIERLNPRDRVVVGQLKVLWEEDGIDLKDVHPYREVGANDIRDILRSGRPVPFVTKAYQWGGTRLKWIRGDDRFDFWKKELQPHLMEPDDPRPGDAFADDYFYKATEWRWEGKDMPYCIVLTQYD